MNTQYIIKQTLKGLSAIAASTAGTVIGLTVKERVAMKKLAKAKKEEEESK